MDCDEFLRGYSEFRDRRTAPPVRERFEDHLKRCGSCRRYDRVVRRGVAVLRALPSAGSSSDFLPRLKHRIYHIEDGIPLSDPTSGGGSALAALATVGLLALAWLPFALQPPSEVELAPVAVQRPGAVRPASASPSLFGRGPFVTPLLEGSDSPAGATSPAGWMAAEVPEAVDELLRGGAGTPLQLH